MSSTSLSTAAGACAVHLVRPTTPRASVGGLVLCMDAFGVRASLLEMAQRMANWGYVVALPDLYFRAGSIWSVLPAGAEQTTASLIAAIRDPVLGPKMQREFMGSAQNEETLTNAIGATLELLAREPGMRTKGFGVTGYCMGGNCALRIAALFPERIAACASFHGGFLATPAPNSPHLGASRIKAQVYVAGASNDGSFTDEMKAALEQSLTSANVRHEIETYPARHGFAVPDSPAFDAAAAERHYAAMEKLLGGALA